MAAIDTTNQSYTSIVNKVIACFNSPNSTYTTDRYTMIKPFVNNPANASGIVASYMQYGDPTGKSYTDQIKFYYGAKYMNLYPLPEATQANCSLIGQLVLGVQNEIQQSDKQYTADGDEGGHNIRNGVLSDILGKLNSDYSNLNCDTYLAQQAQQEQLAQTQATASFNYQQQAQAFQQTSGAAGGGTQIAVWVAVGVAVVIGWMLLKKQKA